MADTQNHGPTRTVGPMDQGMPKPGYYPDPSTGLPRWFDGERWAPLGPPRWAPVADPVDAPSNTTLVVFAYVLAVLFPIAGVILGVVVATRPANATRRHGPWIILLSVVIFILSIVAIVAFNSV